MSQKSTRQQKQPAFAPRKLHRKLENHRGPVHVATYAKGEAKYVLTGGQDRTIRLWNPESGGEIKKYEGHGYEVLSISVFASGGGDRSVYLWNVTAGVTERRMPGHLGKINAVAFNADASVLASGSYDSSVRLWDLKAQNRTPIQVLDEAKDSITCIHVGTAEIITGSVDGHVRTYDMRMGELKSDFIGPPISSISPSVDNQTLLICTLDSKLRLMDRVNGQMLNTFSGHVSNDYRTHACFGHGEGSVVCGDEQGKIWEWDLLNAKAVAPDPPKVHDKVITWVEHHPLEAGEMDSYIVLALLSILSLHAILRTAAPPWQIVLLQGGGYGLGGSLLYAPTVSYMSEWFYVRRGFANGVMNAGTAVGGLVLPLVLPSVIRPHGTSLTLRYLSIVVFVLLSAALPFIRPRLPEDRIRHMATTSRIKWSTNKSFWLLLCVTALQGFAYFLPIVYLPTFAQDMMLNDGQASLALALLNGSSVISRITLGHLSDIFNPWVLATLTLAATSVATFVLWGALVTTIGTLSMYSIIFGALAGGFSSLWTGFVRPIARDDTAAATSMLGMLMLSRVPPGPRQRAKHTNLVGTYQWYYA
ncbi:unnamed protein product [Rhizoctonia solani]|uniref:Uncharacterized protein n=1 Tax=Rhizoctonia solani TaxID=456999 RepID=A0A8H2XQ29_9AGAM|nr:unnamed protein product [Rhizoctonia solani]